MGVISLIMKKMMDADWDEEFKKMMMLYLKCSKNIGTDSLDSKNAAWH